MSRRVYVYDAATDRMVDKHTREPMVPPGTPMALPAVRGDIEPYVSPADGKTLIGGRRAMRDDMRRHDVVDYREAHTEPMGFRSREFAARHGMPLSLVKGE